MKLFNVSRSLFCLIVFSQASAFGGDFATGSASPWRDANYGWQSSPAAQRHRADYAAYRYGPARGDANSNAAYWVERDPRYAAALPSVSRATYRMPLPEDYRGYRAEYYTNRDYWDRYRAAGYNGENYDAYRPTAACRPVYPRPDFPSQFPSGYYPNAPRAAGYAPMPRNYYKGDGLFGKDTVFAKDQPIRNIFRYLLP